ncbi:MAG: hypothetical protein QNL85_00525 [Euryarchaeota archaeon]|jgi:hypothetical protein|tara:strand:- start:96 stop:656 length:561 start_codon:yes stop_codon:yes gene_type:complete
MSGEGEKRLSLAEIPIPNHAPHVPDGLFQAAIAALSGTTKAVFRPWIEDRITVIWLEGEEKRLGMTRFEEGPNELARRRRLRLDPGEVTIGLHPILLEDERMYAHTLVHEFLHAAGLTAHSADHDALTHSVAPAPSFKESPLLQRMRDGVLGDAKKQHWTCKSCGYEWKRTTVRRPTRCHKCARPL